MKLPTDWTWIIALGGAVGMFWQQTKALLGAIRSIFVVTFEIPYENDSFLFYCWDHFRPSVLGLRRFGFENFYLRPHRRMGRVGMEYQGKSLTFWHGYWPLILSLENKGGSNSAVEILTVTYIRGTFNAPTLIHRAAEYHNQMKWGVKSKTTHRYRIIRKFGFILMKDNDGPPSEASDSPRNALSTSGRPIGLTRDELGVPIETEPFKALFYGPEVHNFYTKLQRWKGSRDWYYHRTIPWRLGGILAGSPGTGKTSFVRAAAQSLDFPIIIIDLPSMSNRDLTEAWRECLNLAPAIVLFEDLDRLFTEDKRFQSHDQSFSMRDPVSLDCLLNCISGVEPSEGLITIATANKPEHLDPALLRPGRLDFQIQFTCPNTNDRRHIAARILDKDPEIVEKIVVESKGETGATVVQMATERAISKYWSKEKAG